MIFCKKAYGVSWPMFGEAGDDRATDLQKKQQSLGDPVIAASSARFFKNEHVDGDVFLGLRAATLRHLARDYRELLKDNEDLIHKAAGWMLREVGKRDKPTLEGFLRGNYHKMPRTMLRYAIERFGKEERDAYLKRRLG